MHSYRDRTVIEVIPENSEESDGDQEEKVPEAVPQPPRADPIAHLPPEADALTTPSQDWTRPLLAFIVFVVLAIVIYAWWQKHSAQRPTKKQIDHATRSPNTTISRVKQIVGRYPSNDA